MRDESKTCLNCGAGEDETPVVMWRYQGREFWMCAECLPIIIHKREQLMVKWPPTDAAQQTQN
ncbi:MAG: hypothetical protein FJ030_16165 [Chloroflexi bacterium]|nr:hypothetical protein [Chloroflexota bacterium]